ncbi:MAG TPA: class I tRNA ligase family protein, partial [Usitatibacter sp.]|nr:class I tRNA ligase family protein [Usitatibacter sp.]
FCNKLWNATRFVLMNCEGKDTGVDESKPLEFSAVDRWISSRLQRAERGVIDGLAAYRFDVSARAVYEFVWDEYCDWYVELAKVQLANGNEAQQRATRRTLIRVLEATLRLAHPFIPFITEELWQIAAPLAGKAGESIMVAAYPAPDAAKIDEKAEGEIAVVKEIINAARNLRSTMGLSPAAKVPMYVAGAPEFLAGYAPQMTAIARLSEIHFVDALPAKDAPVSITAHGKLMLHVEVDRAAEKIRLSKEAATLEAQIAKDRASLGNDAFVQKAPAHVVDQMKKRLADNEAKHADVSRQLGKLG